MFVCTLRCHAVGVALSLMVCVSASPCQSPDVWRPILHTEALLDSIPGTAFHFSSYARNGGNNDMGQYYGTDPFGWKILCDVTGPGVVTEFWCTRRPWSDTLRLRVFVDNLSQPAIDTTISRLLGETWPFVPPLADSAMAAWFSYVPIAFQSCVRICYRGASLYYHVNGLSLPVGTDVEPFATPPSPSYQSRLDSLFDRLENPQRPAWPDHTPLYAQGTAQLAAGACSTPAPYAGSGGGGQSAKRVCF